MNSIKTITDNAIRALEALDVQVSGIKAEFGRLFSELSKYQAINFQEVQSFLKEPWCILPKSRDEWWITIPRWVGTQVGWLERSTETYNVFVVNRYSHWLGGIPDELRDRLELPAPVDVKVQDGKMRATPEVAQKLKHHLRGQEEDGSWNIVRGHEFDLIAEIIKMGSLPFVPRPVSAGSLVHNPKVRGFLSENELEHERVAWNEFLKWGAIGVYWPFGCRKSVFGMRAITRISGKKLVVVPTRMLVDQWNARLRNWTEGEILRTTVVTYQSWDRVKNHDWDLVVFDEAHRLPANTFSRMSTVRAKYRIGLSGSPYREDGRTNHIFALTGKPIGTDWNYFIRAGLISKPQVEVRIVGGWREKARITEDEIRVTKGRALVFCDSIEQGKALASRLSCPFVHGQTHGDRLATVNGSRVSVVSRVGDEGLSLQDLEKVIEVDFLGASRRQESQRVGRLFHSGCRGRYITLMTQDEFDRFEGRFLALEEKGIKVEVH